MVAEHWLLLRLNWAMASFGDTGVRNVGLPLPDEFNGKMEQWQEWSWQVKAYVSLFEVEALRVLVNAEVADASITDDALKCLKASDSELRDTELVEFSRHLHRLLTRITSGSAQLVVRRNVELNGFETWRLLTEKFSLPGTAPDFSLLNRILEFKFGTEQFEQGLSEWETLKTEHKAQTETALPDSILVTTLLSRTTGTLRQHLKMNVRLLDTYDAVRNVINAYHQSRHVNGFESPSDTGPSPMEIGGVWKGEKDPTGKAKEEESTRFYSSKWTSNQATTKQLISHEIIQSRATAVTCQN